MISASTEGSDKSRPMAKCAVRRASKHRDAGVRNAASTTLAALLAASFCLGSFGCRTANTEPVQTGYITHTLKSKFTDTERVYAMWVPPNYNEVSDDADESREWPLMIFLHGMGERGDDIEMIIKHGPIKEAMAGREMPFLIVAPQCPKPAEGEPMMSVLWPAVEEDVLNIIEDVKHRYRVDERRIYLTGLSMGGHGSFELAAEHPEMFAAVAPICGFGRAERVDKYDGTPFWVFHGKRDRVVAHSRSVEMVEAMRAMGQNVKFTSYPDEGHDCWNVTYADPDFYAWLLEHESPETE